MIIHNQTNTKHTLHQQRRLTISIYTQSVARILHISAANMNDVIGVQSKYEYVNNNTLNKHV